jgi:hypothetical protein
MKAKAPQHYLSLQPNQRENMGTLFTRFFSRTNWQFWDFFLQHLNAEKCYPVGTLMQLSRAKHFSKTFL